MYKSKKQIIDRLEKLVKLGFFVCEVRNGRRHYHEIRTRLSEKEYYPAEYRAKRRLFGGWYIRKVRFVLEQKMIGQIGYDCDLLLLKNMKGNQILVEERL